MPLMRSVLSVLPTPRRAAAIKAAAMLLLALAGCSSAPKPTTLEATLTAGDGVNPNRDRRASPVIVRVYELKSAAAFESVDFVSLFERERDALGADLVAREEIAMSPGESRRHAKPLGPEVKTLGVAVAFRDLERATWRAVIAVKPNTVNRVVLRLDGIRVTVSSLQ